MPKRTAKSVPQKITPPSALRAKSRAGKPLVPLQPEAHFPIVGIGPRTMLLNARRIERGGDRRILLAIEDVSAKPGRA